MIYGREGCREKQTMRDDDGEKERKMVSNIVNRFLQNGTQDSISKLVSDLNAAKYEDNVGE